VKDFFSELPFASLLAYSPRGLPEVSLRSKKVSAKIKAGNVATIELAMTRISEVFEGVPFHDFLGGDVSLVPTPGSSLRVRGALWVPFQLANYRSKGPFLCGHQHPVPVVTNVCWS